MDELQKCSVKWKNDQKGGNKGGKYHLIPTMKNGHNMGIYRECGDSVA